ncbi:MAG: hypothetical protein PHD25_12400, partial [Bacteroidales bacterium]|nr:hypothetical protein [Bacteroidales bacterium]
LKDRETEKWEAGGQNPLKSEKVKVDEPISVTSHESRVAYLKRFPYAIATKLDLWVLELEYVKMTDNRLGFGKKIEWRRGDCESRRR